MGDESSEGTIVILGVPRDATAGETRVPVVPRSVAELTRLGAEVRIEAGAGVAAGHRDDDYAAAGAQVAPERAELLAASDVLFVLHPPDAATAAGLREGAAVVGLLEPLSRPEAARILAERGATAFALELLPRTTRAQPMDVLSSMATVAGYKAALLAAAQLGQLYPMLITAAGTLAPAQVLVVGAGVAGLQAIATSRRLGAVVTGYDIRPDVKDQVQSLGARFLELELATEGAEDAGGYAKAMDEAFYSRQRELMAGAVAKSDVVITTAAVPGRAAPRLVTAEMVAGMRPGSVIVDLAAEGGGNCEGTVAGETVSVGGVTILGPVNLPASVPRHASQMLARNFGAFLEHLIVDGEIALDRDDDIVRDTLLTRGGEVVHPRVAELLGAATPSPQESPTEGET